MDALKSRAGRSQTFQDPGTLLIGCAGAQVPVSLMEQLLSWIRIQDARIRTSLIGAHGDEYLDYNSPISTLSIVYLLRCTHGLVITHQGGYLLQKIKQYAYCL